MNRHDHMQALSRRRLSATLAQNEMRRTWDDLETELEAITEYIFVLWRQRDTLLAAAAVASTYLHAAPPPTDPALRTKYEWAERRLTDAIAQAQPTDEE